MKTNPGILSADYKVSGGKLLRVELVLSEKENLKHIHSITITGDFFMHPEEAIEDLEKALTGVIFKEEQINKIVSTFFKHGVEVIGASALDFVHVIMNVK